MLDHLLSFLGSKLFFGLLLLGAAVGWWFAAPYLMGGILASLGWIFFTVARIGVAVALGVGALVLLTSGVNDVVD